MIRHLKRAVLAGLAAAVLLCAAVLAWAWSALSDLPDVSRLKQYRPAAASQVLDRNGAFLTHFYEKKFRVWAAIGSLPDHVIRAVVTAEDDTFFGHEGVNYRAVWEALKHDVQRQRFARGGSTITQQMIKNVLLSREKTLTRKLREFVLARRAEEVLTKRQILEIYLNEVEWGADIYGIEAASRYYFDKHATELTRAEAALLAGMLPNPRYYDPFKRLDKARTRQEQVLFNLFQAKHLTQEEYAAALEAPVILRDPSSRRFDLAMISGGNGRSCHLKVLEELLRRFVGEQGLYRQGLTIRTTIDRPLQESLAASLAAGNVSGGDAPDRVLVMREGTEIRAISCSLEADQARFYPGSLGAPEPSYDISVLPLDEVGKDSILLPEPPEAQPAGDTPQDPARKPE